MFDAEAVVQFFLQLAEQGILVFCHGFHQVRGERRFGGAHRPDVQISDLSDSRQCQQIVLHGLHIDTCGDGVHRQVERLFQESPGAKENHSRDGQTHGGVDPVPTREPDENSSQNHAERNPGVGSHMQKRAADVEVMVSATHEKQGGGRVDGHAQRGDGNHACARNYSWGEQPLYGFPSNRSHGREQQQGVEERGQDCRTTPAIGSFGTGGNAGERKSSPRQEQADDITEVVPRVGQESERIVPKTKARFHGDVNQVERNANGEGSAKVGRRVGMVVAHAAIPGERLEGP